MPLVENGGYLYIVDIGVDNILKVGRTSRDPYRRYQSQSSPRPWKLRAAYYFEHASKGNLKKAEDSVLSQIPKQFKTLSGREFFENILFEFIDLLMFTEWLDWREETGLQSLILKDTVQRAKEVAEAAAVASVRWNEPSGIAALLDSRSPHIPPAGPQLHSPARVNMRDEKVKLLHDSLASVILPVATDPRIESTPMTSTQILRLVDFEATNLNFRATSEWLNSRGYVSRRSNGRKLYDIVLKKSVS